MFTDQENGQMEFLQVPIGTVVKSSGSHLAETMMDAGRVHCDPGAVPSSAVPVASTSGRVDPGFWNERRKRHSCSVTQSPGMLFVVDVSIIISSHILDLLLYLAIAC